MIMVVLAHACMGTSATTDLAPEPLRAEAESAAPKARRTPEGADAFGVGDGVSVRPDLGDPFGTPEMRYGVVPDAAHPCELPIGPRTSFLANSVLEFDYRHLEDDPNIRTLVFGDVILDWAGWGGNEPKPFADLWGDRLMDLTGWWLSVDAAVRRGRWSP
jgi:hypothetical protein